MSRIWATSYLTVEVHIEEAEEGVGEGLLLQRVCVRLRGSKKKTRFRFFVEMKNKKKDSLFLFSHTHMSAPIRALSVGSNDSSLAEKMAAVGVKVEQTGASMEEMQLAAEDFVDRMRNPREQQGSDFEAAVNHASDSGYGTHTHTQAAVNSLRILLTLAAAAVAVLQTLSLMSAQLRSADAQGMLLSRRWRRRR